VYLFPFLFEGLEGRGVGDGGEGEIPAGGKSGNILMLLGHVVK
jgi:hypothetical protein